MHDTQRTRCQVCGRACCSPGCEDEAALELASVCIRQVHTLYSGAVFGVQQYFPVQVVSPTGTMVLGLDAPGTAGAVAESAHQSSKRRTGPILMLHDVSALLRSEACQHLIK